MRDALSKKIVDIEPSGIRKFFDIVSEMPDAISLGVGEPDFDIPYRVREEGIYSLEKGRTFYTSNAGLKELRDEISRYIARKYNLNYSAEDEIMVTVGGSEAIDVALRCMVDPGDEVLIPQPCYVSYVPCAVMADAKPVAIELKAENEFKLTKEELIASITDKLDGYLARKNNQVTTFGKFLDPIADKILVIATMVMFVEMGRIPAWIPIIVIFREFLVSGYRLIAVENSGKVIAANIWGKLKTVTQMIAIILMFLTTQPYFAFASKVEMNTGDFIINIFASILMTISVIATILSGYEYLKEGKDLLKDC